MAAITMERSDGVAVITLDNGPSRNALNPAIAAELIDVCEEIDADGSLGAAVVRGANETFCSGADRALLDAPADQAGDEMYQAMGSIYRSFHRVGQLAVPTIAAVRGAAVGAGTNLMSATDLRIVAEDARIISGFLRIGVHPGGGFFTLVGRSAGREAAAALGLFGESLTGRQAVEAGLAWEAVPDGDVEGRALDLAARAARDPELARLATQTMRRELGPPSIPWDVAIDYERPSQMWSLARRAAAHDASAND